MLLLGTVADLHQFVPKYAIIIQNKDDLKIPINLEQIPNSKEFKDSLYSLSPEQQRFARAYRSMQLAQTLFGILVIQIKPQLEKLLRLNDDSLTKEIKLTQDLLDLFITYNVPSDLISYAGNPNATTNEKIDAVKKHVASLQEMLNDAKEKEIKAAKEERRYNAGPVKPLRKRKPSWGPRESDFASYNTKPAGKGHAQVQPSLSPGDKLHEGEGEARLRHEPDYTLIPAELDRRFERLDEDSALRPTIMKVGQNWQKTSQAALLADPATAALSTDDQKNAKDRAYDLLDSMSRSGCLSIEEAQLHIVLAATHSFDKTLMDTVIQQNVNPIEKVERSTLILASTIQNREVADLLRADQVERVSTYSPMLFPGGVKKSVEPLQLEGKKDSPLQAPKAEPEKVAVKKDEEKGKDKGKTPK